jgi:hypothetical protein
MRKLLAFILELAMVMGGAWVLYWQLFGPGWRGLFVIGGAMGVSIGSMLLYEDFIKPSE